jgi:glycosyltransferase involved in cell wall biosynthesis
MKILFASAHSIVDFSNGASVATLDVLQGLTSLGFESQAFCTLKLDLPHEAFFEEIIATLREPYQLRSSACGPYRAEILYTRRRDVPVTVVRLDSTRHGRQRPEEVGTVLEFFGKYLDALSPDAMLTYGGDPVSTGMIDRARHRGIPVVFAIHNLNYHRAPPLTDVDHRIVASEFARRHYRDHIGLECQALPNPVDWDRVRVRAEDRQPRFVTFVNPVLDKGAYPFVRIAHELGRRRPDISLLVVESRGTQGTLAACGLGRDEPVNVQVMAHTTDPRRFYARTRIALLPSLCPENQPLVAVESMINGIPVIGSDRGGIPEVLGEAGLVRPLPERLTPDGRIMPEAEEVEPWVQTIIRLWDDRAFYEEQSARARAEAERWHPDRVRPLYAEFFRSVCHRAKKSASGMVSTNGTVHPPGPMAARRLHRPEVLSGGKPAVNGLARADDRESSGRDSTHSREQGICPLSFIVCVSDETLLAENLLASPCLQAGSPHEVISLLKAPNAADGLNFALERAEHDWLVLVHQDVYLPPGWDRLAMQQLRQAERRFGTIGIAGVYGVGEVRKVASVPLRAERIGWVVDRGRELRQGGELPAPVAILDELLLILPRHTPFRADPALGVPSLRGRPVPPGPAAGPGRAGSRVPCHHRSRNIGLNGAFFDSARAFRQKWAGGLPIATPCVVFDTNGEVFLLGNADESSIAQAEGGPICRFPVGRASSAEPVPIDQVQSESRGDS